MGGAAEWVLQAYMISSLQSIASYAMLIDKLRDNMTDTHLEFLETVSLAAEIGTFNTAVDNAKHKYEKLLNIQVWWLVQPRCRALI